MNKQDFQIRARFRHACRLAGLHDRATILLAVSGGCDSVTLLHLCRDEATRRGWRLVVGHLDHRWRPDSQADAIWVRDLAQSLGLSSIGLKVRPEYWDRTQGMSLEDAARRIRRRALHRMAKQCGADRILLGHTRDDQAETVLMNLLRGAGIRGLTGMRGSSARWARPLLGISRGKIRAYAERRGLAWREDPANSDPRFLRSQLRQQIFPALEDVYGPGVSAVLARTAENLRPLRRFLEAEVEVAWTQTLREIEPGRIRLDRPLLASYHQAVVAGVMRRAVQRLRGTAKDLQRSHIFALTRAVAKSGPRKFSLPARMCAYVDSREVRLEFEDLG